MSFIYEASLFFAPPPFLIQQSIWKWCLSVCVYTHVRACVHVFTRSFVCRSSRLNGGRFPAAPAAELLPSCIDKLVPSPQQRWPCFSGMNLLPGHLKPELPSACFRLRGCSHNHGGSVSASLKLWCRKAPVIIIGDHFTIPLSPRWIIFIRLQMCLH